MSNEFVTPTDVLRGDADLTSAGVAPVLKIVAADDALLCVDDACLPPELRDRDPDAPALEGVDR